MDTALRLRLFDILDQSPKTASELAQLTNTSLRGITMILDALVGLEFLSRSGERYSVTPESSNFLVSTKPGYYGGMFEHTARQLLPKWMKLPEIVRTGKPAGAVNDETQGSEFFANFVEALFPLSLPAAQTLAKHLRLKEAKEPVSVLDLAAGSGVWGVGLAQESSNVRVRAVDWPDVLKVTQRVFRRFGLEDRLILGPGDLAGADFGANHQVATLGHILHSQGAEDSRKLLRRTFDALAPGGTISVMEFLANDERTGPPNALIFAVNMLVNTENGNTFSFREISEWLREAGFENPCLLEVPAPSPLILANRPK